MAQTITNLPAMQGTQVWSLGRQDPLEEGMTTHSSILGWEIPWTEEPGRLQSMESQRVGHDWSDLAAAVKRGKHCSENFGFSVYALQSLLSLYVSHIFNAHIIHNFPYFSLTLPTGSLLDSWTLQVKQLITIPPAPKIKRNQLSLAAYVRIILQANVPQLSLIER